MCTNSEENVEHIAKTTSNLFSGSCKDLAKRRNFSGRSLAPDKGERATSPEGFSHLTKRKQHLLRKEYPTPHEDKDLLLSEESRTSHKEEEQLLPKESRTLQKEEKWDTGGDISKLKATLGMKAVNTEVTVGEKTPEKKSLEETIKYTRMTRPKLWLQYILPKTKLAKISNVESFIKYQN